MFKPETSGFCEMSLNQNSPKINISADGTAEVSILHDEYAAANTEQTLRWTSGEKWVNCLYCEIVIFIP